MTDDVTDDQPSTGSSVATRVLPQSSSAIAAFRKVKSAKTINDMVEELWVQAFDDVPNFPALNNGTKADKQFVEGSEVADDIVVAVAIRDLAASQPRYTLVAQAKLDVIRRAVLVTRGRYGVRRAQLAETNQAAE